MYTKLTQFMQDEDGQSLIEYSLIASIVAVGAIAAMIAMRAQIITLFNTIVKDLK